MRIFAALGLVKQANRMKAVHPDIIQSCLQNKPILTIGRWNDRLKFVASSERLTKTFWYAYYGFIQA